MKTLKLFSLLSLITLFSCSNNYEHVFSAIKDPALAGCIIKEMKKTSISDLASVERLLCQNKGVKDLKGLGELTKLKELYLQDNDLTSLSTLDALPSLRIISVAGNDELTSLEGLEKAYNLEELQANKCKNLVDISATENLSNLKTVGLMMDAIEDISSFSSLVKLENVVLSYNKIQSIHGLANKPNLKKLTIYDNPVQSIASLLSNPEMMIVGVGGNNINHCKTIDALRKRLKSSAKVYGPKACEEWKGYL